MNEKELIKKAWRTKDLDITRHALCETYTRLFDQGVYWTDIRDEIESKIRSFKLPFKVRFGVFNNTALDEIMVGETPGNSHCIDTRLRLESMPDKCPFDIWDDHEIEQKLTEQYNNIEKVKIAQSKGKNPFNLDSRTLKIKMEDDLRYLRSIERIPAIYLPK